MRAEHSGAPRAGRLPRNVRAAVRFIFSPPAEHAAGLLTLPWDTRLADWDDERLIEVRNAGLHRHVVKFVAEGDDVFVLKELPEELARREYRLLRHLAEISIPAVHVLGLCIDRAGLDAVLVTRFLDFSATYRSLLTSTRGGLSLDSLLGGMVELRSAFTSPASSGAIARCRPLFRLDAGDIEAYLVDAETAEIHPTLTDGQRAYDLDLAYERIAGELFDLQAGDLLSQDVDPIETAQGVVARYGALWNEVTREDVVTRDEQRYKIGERIQRMEELGFDVDEVELITVDGGAKVRLRTRAADPGRWRRILMTRTGLDVQDQQARRLLSDMAAYRAWLEQSGGRPVPELMAASRWLAEVYDPVVTAIPTHLRAKLDSAEVFHEVLEHRWFLSERAGRDVGTTAAASDYFARVLPHVPDSLGRSVREHEPPVDHQASDESDELSARP